MYKVTIHALYDGRIPYSHLSFLAVFKMWSSFSYDVVAIATVLQLVTSVSATGSLKTCTKIAATTKIEIEWPLTPAYKADQALYW